MLILYVWCIVCRCADGHACMDACMWRPEVHVRYLPQLLSTYFLRWGLSINMKLNVCLCWLASELHGSIGLHLLYGLQGSELKSSCLCGPLLIDLSLKVHNLVILEKTNSPLRLCLLTGKMRIKLVLSLSIAKIKWNYECKITILWAGKIAQLLMAIPTTWVFFLGQLGWRREPLPASCLLTSTPMPCHVCTHTHAWT